MMMSSRVLCVLGATALFLNGCAPRLGGSDYGIGGVGEFSETYSGTIASKRVVRLSAKKTGGDNTPGIGALAGAGVGALAGSQIGYGKGAIAAAVAGGLLGGVGGHYAEDALTTQDGFEYGVRLDDGRLITVTQGGEPNLGVGQRVNVIKSGRDRSRVVPAY